MKSNAFHNYFLQSKVNDQSINQKMIKVTLMVIPMESVNYKKCLLEKQ